MAGIIEQLASSLGRRDEVPNLDLALQIIKDKDRDAVKELVQYLSHNSKAIRHDSIKVLYEVAAGDPKLIAPYTAAFIELLDHKDNRMQWGAMTALSAITKESSKAVYDAIDTIIAVADKGSVITNDHCVRILVQLCSDKKYATNTLPLLLERLKKSPGNQLPMYAEMSCPVVPASYAASFIELLQARITTIEKESKRKRVEKVIRQLQAL